SDFEPFMAQKSHYIMHLARYLNRMSPTDSADEPKKKGKGGKGGNAQYSRV
ncbi:hypothetical protein SAMN05421881_11541, partial [Nitrosomonas halophila]